MRRASVLLPTHEHASTLPYAVASVQAQGVDDLEILIVGDGVNDEVRGVIAALQSRDPRIRFFDFPKGPREGEIHRDAVLRQAQGEIIYYQCDDDLWLPDHLNVMEAALADADFVGAMHVNVEPDDRVSGFYFDLQRGEFVTPWLDWIDNDFGGWASNGFGLQCAAHRLDAYRRLPEGWTTTAPGLPPSQVMWHKFARQSWCRLKYLPWPVALRFSAPDRRDWTAERRAAELQRWSEIVASPNGILRIHRSLLADLGDRLLSDTLQRREVHRSAIARLEQELEHEQAQRTALNEKCAGLLLELKRVRDECEREFERKQIQCAALKEECASALLELRRVQSERDALLATRSWRMAAPLRAVATMVRRLRPS